MGSHTGLWPLKRKQPRARALAVYFSITHQVIDEYGQVYDVDSWPELVHVAVEGHYDVYTPPLLIDDPLLQDMIADDHCRVLASKTGGVLGVQYIDGRNRATFAESRTWGYEYPSHIFLAALRRFFDFVGVGEYVSPGALGEALWAACRSTAVSTPSFACCRDLRDHSLGGRADTPGLGRRLLLAYEIDMRGAYLSFLKRVPTGTAMRMRHEPSDNRPWFAPCYVRVPRNLAGFGPVGYRDAESLRFPSYGDNVREPFHTWLWSREVSVARRLGYEIFVEAPGWEWAQWDVENAAYLTELWRLRETCPTEEYASWLKLVGVASIGRQAIPPLSYRIVDDHNPAHTDADIPLIGDMDAPISGYWLHAEEEEDATPRVTHWWAYTLMRCRMELWGRMELERMAGNTVVLSNYDGILLENPSAGPTTAEPGYGEWRQTTLRRVFVPYPRAIVSEDKTTLPGASRERRGDYAY